jgi:hypothetical protein
MHADSIAAVRHLGPAAADRLARDPPDFDHAHVGPRGARYFARRAAR